MLLNPFIASIQRTYRRPSGRTSRALASQLFVDRDHDFLDIRQSSVKGVQPDIQALFNFAGHEAFGLPIYIFVDRRRENN